MYGLRRPGSWTIGLYRVALSGGRFSEAASLSLTKDSVMAAAIRDLLWDACNRPLKMPRKAGVFFGQIVAH